ncbi:DNA polymerase III epsilon subunit [hydrothermal vent metagenome]|uniref:DNA polymerase III subunit epsilon n=1 Tax=hydrothermal vent metagenome TaxID=652676 RepID=A0A3B0WMV1_9ZZZZ
MTSAKQIKNRQIVLDTETTGLDPKQGHKIIEIGCVEMINRRLTGNNYHQFIQPDRDIDEGAQAVHGISNEFLADKPRFADVVKDFIEYIDGAELIIHNAPFDVGFIDHEFKWVGEEYGAVASYCSVIDTLVMARKMRPGKKNNLDALCKEYEINNAHRELHGALLDAELLAEVYLRMSGGQSTLLLDSEDVSTSAAGGVTIKQLSKNRKPIKIIRANDEELKAHQAIVEKMRKTSWQ